MRAPFKTAVAALCASLLILLSPGLPAYHAAAAMFTGPTGKAGPGPGWTAAVHSLLSARDFSAFAGRSASGVELQGALSSLSRLDLTTPAGRRTLAPVLDRLDGPVPAEGARERAALAVAAAVARQRAKAEEAVAEAAKAADAAALSSSLDKLRDAAILGVYLQPAQLKRVFAAHGEARTRLTRLTGARVERQVGSAARAWDDKKAFGDEMPVPASMGEAARAPLARAEARPAPSAPLIPLTPAVQPSKLKRFGFGAAAGAAGAGALALAAATSGVAPILALAAGLVASIVLHEGAHLWMLRRLGDDTARKYGRRVTPLDLVDPWGTVLVPLITLSVSTAVFGFPLLFGWAKPVPVDFNKLADPRLDTAKVAMAGPAVNLAAAALGFAATLVVTGGAAALVLGAFWKLNLALAALNLLPLPHLDGGKLLIRLLPERFYQRWIRNDKLPGSYQSTFQKLYEGPANILNRLHIHEQAHVNGVTRALGLLALVGFYALSFSVLGAPLVLLMLACSYDYYCIREKIQNEAAVQSLISILQDFAGVIAAAAEEDESIKSEVNAEEVEHVLKNALEDMIDKVVDSPGFSALSDDEKWERFRTTYLEEAVGALKKKGLSADDPETIRGLLTGERSKRFWEDLKAWMARNEVWAKWHSPARKAGVRDSVKKDPKEKTLGGGDKLMGMALMGIGSLFGGGPGFFGGLEDVSKKAQKPFAEALEDPSLRLSDKEKGFLQLMLKEMKLEKKPPVIGRVDEMQQVVSAVTAPRGVISSVVLIGKAGVGKTAVAEKLAQAMALSEAQPAGSTFELRKMRGRYLLRLNLARLLQQDDPAAALDALLQLIGRFNEESPRGGNKVVLFVDEIHQMFEHPKGTQMANLLKEPLRDGELTVVAATTESEYKKYMEADDAFKRRLVPIRVEESSVEETVRTLQGAKAFYEGLYELSIDPAALKAAADLSKYDQEVYLPGRAFKYLVLAANEADYDGQRDRLSFAIEDKVRDLQYALSALAEHLGRWDRVTQPLKEEETDAITLYNRAVELTKELVTLYAKRRGIPTSGTPVLTEDLVKELIARKTGVAAGQLTLGQEKMEKYLEMEASIAQRVIGQDHALKTIADAVRANKAGLSDPTKPLGVFYLTGPTGSGKTHLAKELARFLFNDPNAVVRLDMSEYMHDHEVSKMIGSPPGYVGYGQGGQLTEKVRKKPYSVVLFDEIEKAHPAVWLLLLQVLSEGRLTDGEGRTIDFKNTIILMTSNLGMYAVDVEPYEREFKVLQQAAREATDETTRQVIELKKAELAARLSAETKALSEKITAEAFRKTYPPEFEGRLHAPPIVFNRITPDMAEKIVDLNLAELGKMLAFAGNELSWDQKTVKHLVDEGFSIALGARPLQNAIQRFVTQPIANAILKDAAAGSAPGPKKIAVTVEGGKIAIAVSPLPPKPVTKKTVEGAAQEVFTQALDAALQGAANHTQPNTSLEVVDSWVRAALDSFTPAAENLDEKAAPAAQPAPADTQDRSASAGSSSGSSSHSRFQPGVAQRLTAAPTSASHYEVERKDAGVKAARTALTSAISSLPEADQAVALDFLKLFVEQAKKMAPEEGRSTPVSIAFEKTDAGLTVAVTRPGGVGEKEKALLATHFAGTAPESEEKSRTKAEALNVIGKDGRRLWFELARALSAIPGATLGYGGEAQTQYWVTLPARVAPVVEPAPEPVQDSAVVPERDTRGKIYTMRGSPAYSDPALVWLRLDSQAVAADQRQAVADALLAELGLTREALSEVDAAGGRVILARAADRTAAAAAALELNNSAQVAEVVIHPDAFDALGAAAQGRTPADASQPPPVAAASRIVNDAESAAGEVWVQFRQTTPESATLALLERLGVERGRYWNEGSGYRVQVLLDTPAEAARIAAALAAEDAVESVTVHPDARALMAAAPAPTRTFRFLAEAPGWDRMPSSTPLDGARRGLADPAMKRLGQQVVRQMGDLGFETQARVLASAFLRGFSDELKGFVPNARVHAGFDLGPRGLKLVLGLEGAPFTAEEIERLRAFVADRAPMRQAIEDLGARVGAWNRDAESPAPGAALVWLELPRPEPRSAAPLTMDQPLDVAVEAPLDRGFHRAKQALLDVLRAGDGERAGESPAIVGFLYTAARWAKQKARGDGGSVSIRWKVDGDQVTVAVVRVSPSLPEAVEWQYAIRDDAQTFAELERLQVTLSSEPLEDPAPGLHARELSITYRRPAPRPAAAPAPEPAQAPVVAPAAPAVPLRAGAALRKKAREFALALLAQGDERGPTLRMTAAETLALVSTPEDLVQAREWLAEGTLDPAYGAAGALIVARHGTRDDERRLRAAMAKTGAYHYNGHAFNPLKARLAEAYAQLVGRRDDLLALYEAEKAKPAVSWAQTPDPDRNKVEVALEALYLALTRNGGPEAMAALRDDWNNHRVVDLYDYTARVEPARLRALYERWSLSGRKPDGPDRVLTLLAIADFGGPEDLLRLQQIVRTGWDGVLDNQTYSAAGQALARMTARGLSLGWRQALRVRDEAKDWAQEDLHDSNTFPRVLAAMFILGETGGAAELSRVEDVVRYDPARVAFVHEMTQHEAALAWARIVARSGLLLDYLTKKQGAALPRILAMLAETSAVVNKAALEAVKLHAGPSPRQRPLPSAPERQTEPAAAPAAPQAAHPFLKDGAAPGGGHSEQTWYDESALDADSTAVLARLGDGAEQGRAWRAQWQELAARLTGLSFEPSLRIARAGSKTYVVFNLRQAVTRALEAAVPASVRELARLLLHLATDQPAAREEKLARLEREHPGARAAYATLAALAGRARVTMGVDHDPARAHEPGRGELEVWLAFELLPRPSRVR